MAVEATPFKLIIEDDEGRRTVVPVELGEVSVGRLEGNTIRLNERNVSRHHARLVRNNGKVVAEDLDSYNGIFINGERIQSSQQLHEGDLLRVGDFQLELRGEGLQRRNEETTQRTVMPPDLDATQPGIRLPDGEYGDETETEVDADPEPRAEPTAIIRFDSNEDSPSDAKPINQIAGERPKLICVSTSLAGQEFEVAQTEVVLGRTEDNTIQVDHRSVSRHHAKIVATGRNYKIIDLNSANGTLVNGEQYAQLSLKSGDLIELGHVKFRFVPPGHSYTLTADEQASVRNAMHGGGTGPMLSPAGRGTSVFDVLKNNPLGAAALGSVIAGLLVVVVLVLTAGGDEPKGTILPTPQAEGDTQMPAVSAAAGRVEQARESMKNREWSKAIRLLKSAVDRVPEKDVGEVLDLQDKAEVEKANQDRYDAAKRAIEAQDWEAARRYLSEISEDSVYYRDSQDLLDQVTSAVVSKLVGQARQDLEDASAMDGSAAAAKVQEAERLIARIEGLDQTAVPISGLREKLAEVKAKLSRTAPKPKPKPAAKTKPSKQTRRPPPVAPPPVVKPQPVRKSATELYKEGVSAYKAGNTGKAIASLTGCVKAEPKQCLCYRALGVVYAKAGNGKNAAKHYKLYLKYCPGAQDAHQVRTLLKDYENR